MGRAWEREALLKAYEVTGMNGQVAVLEGEAGIGKTHLAEEFLRPAREAGAAVVSADCYAGQAELTYGPFVERPSPTIAEAVDDGRLGKVPGQHLTEASQLLPHLADPGGNETRHSTRR